MSETNNNTTTQNSERLLSVQETARYLNVSEDFLYHYRMLGQGPRCIKLGKKLIRYSLSSLEEWLKEGSRNTENPKEK